MTYRTEKRTYPTINKQGKKSTMKVGYTLYFNGDVLVDVRNEYNFSVEKNSETWEYFSQKYTK